MYLFRRKQGSTQATTWLLKRPRKLPRQNLQDHRNAFDFAPWLDESQAANFSALASSNPALAPDIAASALRALAEANLLGPQVRTAALHCCRDIVQHLGYTETNRSRLSKDVDLNNANVLVIPGCQTRELLESRVTKAREVWEHVVRVAPWHSVITSGQGPWPHARIPDEARRIENLFQSHYSQDDLKFIHFTSDSDATRTYQNIAAPFADSHLASDRPNNIFWVSNSFHLVGLAQDLQRYVAAEKPAKQVDAVVLVGSEPDHATTEPALNRSIYLKYMLFYIYRYLLPKHTKGRNRGT